MTDLTIRLPDDVVEHIAAEARARGVSAEDLAREAVERQWKPRRRRVLQFAALGDAPPGFSTARAEQSLDEEGFGTSP